QILGAMRTRTPPQEGGTRNFSVWAEDVRRGATVVTTGPEVRLDVVPTENGEFQATAMVAAREAGDRFELVMNGTVVAIADANTTTLSLAITPPETSWIAARVVRTETPTAGDDAEGRRFAHTNLQILKVNDLPLPRRRAYLPLLRQCLDQLEEWTTTQAYYEQPKAAAERLAMLALARASLAERVI
ncbi:MAG: hypothetical protein ACRCZF_00470, partial [Gemmataceae bacterium]